jgi:hypothetical protein
MAQTKILGMYLLLDLHELIALQLTSVWLMLSLDLSSHCLPICSGGHLVCKPSLGTLIPCLRIITVL